VFQECYKYRSLIKTLVLKDLKLKYRGSVLGVVWSLLRPLLMIGVYTIAFKFVVRIQMENYIFFLFIGLLPWNFFQGAVMASTGSISDNGNLIKKVLFPRATLPISTVLFNLAQFLLAVAVFLPLFLFFSNVALNWGVLLFFPLVTLHLFFTIGLALILSALTSSFRDIIHLTEVGLLLLFWLTPVIYPITMVPARFQFLMKLNPLAAFSIAYQDILFWGRVPELLVLSSIIGWTLAFFILGHLIFKWYDPYFAELV
jgi:lipopolysaccharide transport system permease protein